MKMCCSVWGRDRGEGDKNREGGERDKRVEKERE